MSDSRTPEEWIERLRVGMADPKVQAAVADAPTPPLDAIELLRATGCPIGRNAKKEQAA